VVSNSNVQEKIVDMFGYQKQKADIGSPVVFVKGWSMLKEIG
jgi:hypothetical protein